MRLQGNPDLVQVAQLLRRDYPDECPPVRHRGQQPFAVQPLDGLPQRSPADPQRIGQLNLVEPLASAKLAADDGVPQHLDGAIAESLADPLKRLRQSIRTVHMSLS